MQTSENKSKMAEMHIYMVKHLNYARKTMKNLRRSIVFTKFASNFHYI